MNRTQIESAVSTLALRQGYTPLISSKSELEAQIVGYPLAWIEPLKMLSIEGRSRGTMRHSLTLTLLDDYLGKSPANRCERLTQLESDALDILTQLSLTEGVIEIESMTISPSLTATTRYGDIAQVCSAIVTTYF